ncbi:MAG TPA: hypothetical protein VM370_09370 [Candidatus Thermoplasmatota archaeon]|nr:hypothetical protein [Candidatus Thermoplasmatota archaeon]
MAIKSDFMATIPPLTRLSAPTFEPEAEAVYRAALDALEAARVPYLLGGALALNAHSGVWRDTKDLDVFVRPEDARPALDALAESGFTSELVYESWLGKGWKGDVFVDVIWRNANALFPVTDEWLARPARVSVLGREAPVVPLEELLVSKMMVMGRYRFDGADMLHVLYMAADAVDWDRLARLCGEHIGIMVAHMQVFRWAYPAQRDKVPLAVLARYAALAEGAQSSMGPFRGRLIDIQSFEVDVQEWGMPDPHRLALERIFGTSEGRS